VQKDSRENILTTSLNVFGRLGFNKTTMNDIAEAAKRGRRTIYTYFQNKEEIFSAVIEKESRRIVNDLSEIVYSEKLDSIKKLESFSEKRMLFILDLMENRVALKNTYQKNFNIVEKVRLILDRGEIDLISKIVIQGIEEGKITECIPLQLARSIHLVYKAFEFDLIKRDGDDYAKQVDAMLKILKHGIINKN
jgi:AcrR family transcriptional regulator